MATVVPMSQMPTAVADVTGGEGEAAAKSIDVRSHTAATSDLASP